MTRQPRPMLELDGAAQKLRGRQGLEIDLNPSNPPPPPPPPPTQSYRPIQLTWDAALSNSAQIAALNTQGAGLIDIPTDATLTLWPYSNPDGALLNVWIESLGSNVIGVLPEFVKSDGTPWLYQWQTSTGFKRDATYYYTMIIPRRGILGLGPNTVIGPNASSFTQAAQPLPTSKGGAGFFDIDGTEKVGCQMSIMRCQTANAYFGNFEMRGRSYGGVAYSAISCNNGSYCVENIYFNAAHRGDMNAPNREAGALTTQKGTFPTVRLWRNIEIECRDSTGARVASSPWMLNNGTGCDIRDMYGHHSRAGMPTAYNFKSTTTYRMNYARIRSEWNGSGGGSLNGSCMNWELIDTLGTTAPVEITGPSIFIANWTGTTDPAEGTGNTALHFSGGSDASRCVINVRNAGFDKGPRPRNGTGTPETDIDQQGLHTVALQLFGYTPQYGIQLNRYDLAGNLLPVYVYGTVTA